MTAGFGIERLGLFSLRFPWVCLILVALVTPVLLYGASRLEFSSDLREIFESRADAFETLDEVNAKFPGSEREVQVVVEDANLFAALETLRDLHDRLGEVKGVRDVLSPFSATRPPGGQGAGQPLIPQDLDAVDDMEELRRRVVEHPLVAGKLMSRNANLAVFAVALEGNDPGAPESRAAVERIGEVAESALHGSGLQARLTGLSVMRGEIVGALIRDQQTLRYGALAIVLLVCLVVFRNFRYTLIAAAPAALGVIWLLGLMWLTGRTVNILTNIAPTIVLVIAFSDSVHLLFGVRDALEEGKPLREAVERSVREVGPACVLTSLTTALALGSLVLVEHSFIADFGVIAASGAALALVANLLVLPALAALLLAGMKTAPAEKSKDVIRRSIEALCRWAAAASTAAPRAIALGGVAIAVAAGWAHGLNEPMYRYVDNLPRDNPAYEAIGAIDRELGGANTVKLLLSWPQDHDFSSQETLEAAREAQRAVEEQPEFAAPFSLATIADWLGGGERGDAAVAQLLEQQPDSPLLAGVAAPRDSAALVTARFRDLTAAELVPPLDRLNARLAQVEADHPGLDITVTGMVPISAEASYAMIRQLNLSLLAAIAVIILFIALALRSPASGAASVLPNVLPVVAGGLFLWLTGEGLQFTSVVAFTVGFGLAVDSTIHMLNRYRIERERAPDLNAAISAAVTTVGPIVVISTIVVASGLGVAMISELPMVRLYGQVAVVVLVTALVADLLVLPAALAAIERLRGRK